MSGYKCSKCGTLLKQGYACVCGSDMADYVEEYDSGKESVCDQLTKGNDMSQLKEMLEAYRNGERGLPTYDELATVAENDSVFTEEQISVGGRWLADNSAATCGVNLADNWMVYGDAYIKEFRGALAAAERAK